MSQSLRQARALAIYRDQLNALAEQKRQARRDRVRRRLLRQLFTDRSGWLFAVASIGAGFAVVLITAFS